MMSAGIMSIIYVLCCIMTFFGTKEIDGLCKFQLLVISYQLIYHLVSL